MGGWKRNLHIPLIKYSVNNKYENNKKQSKGLWSVWLDAIHNVLYTKVIRENNSKKETKNLIKHANKRYQAYDNNSRPASLLKENILNDHKIPNIDLLAWKESSSEAKAIQWYIKLFAKKLNKKLDVFI